MYRNKNLLTNLLCTIRVNRKKFRLIVYSLIVIGVLFSSSYAYAQNTISKMTDEVFNTIKEDEWRVDDYVLFPPSMKIILKYQISNPTKIPLKFKTEINFFAGDYVISHFVDNKTLLPQEVTFLIIELSFDTQILEKIYGNVEGYDSFTMDGWFKVQGNIMFLPVESTINFNNENVSDVLPLFDIPLGTE